MIAPATPMRSFAYDLPAASPLEIDGASLTIEDVVAVARLRRRVRIAEAARARVRRARTMVEVLLESGERVYGLTTGFGKLRDVAIPQEKAAELQVNLLRSHACGVGRPFPEDVVRAATLLRANTLCRGCSGVRLETVEELVRLLNDDVFPFVPEKGSVGASGDLAPLSHLALVLVGDPGGRYYPRERRRDARAVADPRPDEFLPMPGPDELAPCASREGWTFRPVALAAKEGLALNNGTQFMTAIACLAAYDAYFTLRFAELAAAMSLEAQRGVRGAYDPRLHAVRALPAQADVARRVIAYCEGSQILDLYLNSAHVHRARLHLAEADERLADAGGEADRDGTLARARAEIAALARALDHVVPEQVAEVERLRDLPEREQIAVLKEHLAPVRQAALSILQAVEGPAFPRTAGAAKARSALVAVVDQLTKAVPDAPLVQDDYSFRCAPQVLACCYRALWHVAEVVEIEVNSATDNPLLFPPPADASLGPDEYAAWLRASPERLEACRRGVLGGGNFHGQPIATAADYLAIAVAEAGSIAERRVAHLVDDHHSRGLPSFLIDSSGLHSGFMIAQYTAAALVSENKVLCHPASVDSIPTCANTEDHVSMGTHAARKAVEVVRNVRTVVAIELLAAYQGLGFREPLLPGVPIRRVVEALRAAGVERLGTDRVLAHDVARVEALLGEPALLRCL